MTWLLFLSESPVHKVIKAWLVFVWIGGLVLSFWGVWGNVWFGSPVTFYKHSSFCDVSKEEIRHHFCSFTVYHVSWNMLLLPSNRVRRGEPAVFHGTLVDPHSSVLVIARRVKCMSSLLVAHTPWRCPLHSAHPKVTLRWCLFLPCGFWKLIWCLSQEDVVETILGHSCVVADLSLALAFTVLLFLISFLFFRVTHSPPCLPPECLDFFFFKF